VCRGGVVGGEDGTQGGEDNSGVLQAVRAAGDDGDVVDGLSLASTRSRVREGGDGEGRAAGLVVTAGESDADGVLEFGEAQAVGQCAAALETVQAGARTTQSQIGQLAWWPVPGPQLRRDIPSAQRKMPVAATSAP
jgi:hypothetical protein